MVLFDPFSFAVRFAGKLPRGYSLFPRIFVPLVEYNIKMFIDFNFTKFIFSGVFVCDSTTNRLCNV